jgi:hypothetical protein
MTQLLQRPQLTQVELNALDTELTLRCLDGTLTEGRFDEIVGQLLPHAVFTDAAMTMLGCGQPAWRKKWTKGASKYNLRS